MADSESRKAAKKKWRQSEAGRAWHAADAQRRYRESDPERKRAQAAASYARHKVQCRDKNLQKKGWTLQSYQAAFDAQQGLCAICNHPPGNIALSADHCHASGRSRQLLCVKCNTLLGSARDSIALLNAAAEYLARPAGPK